MHPSRTRWIFLAAVVVHLITAWFSTGYYAADEHYQIIEFAQARMGEFPKDQLAWEYADRLRSGLLPTLCVAVFKTAGAAGASSPFLLAFLLRALTAIVAMAIVKRFVGSAWHLVKEPLRPAFLFLSFFIWFLPFQTSGSPVRPGPGYCSCSGSRNYCARHRADGVGPSRGFVSASAFSSSL
ncbi:MAG: hypothetical protein IPH00_07455 [Flavobacteriales bacterium]|nr:hypothetical protein [Flavobacteriales bacterium]